jgi:hydrogenase maturation protein HypF
VLKPAVKNTFRSPAFQRLRIIVRGAVQGVGFRPFVYRLAREVELTGWINNSSQGVLIEVEGTTDKLQDFLSRLSAERPSLSFIQSLESSYLDPRGFTGFEIRESDDRGSKTAFVLPDIATCADCIADVFDPSDRRYRYPFTNCTNCGPRYSIIKSLPYDRPNTTMRSFNMCSECRSEYDDPTNRRFHAQPNACPQCGPRLELFDSSTTHISSHDDALKDAAAAIREGKIVAVKGLGGFHLMVDARNGDAVRELRHRKHREEKPFAVMFPTAISVSDSCEINDIENRLLLSPESPIVLLKKRSGRGCTLSDSIAPRNPYIGAMLAYTPLHHLLMLELSFPVVATSGNLSDEPICTTNEEAFTRLARIADQFLVHDRSIVRHVDDSIVREMMGREMVIRRARGFAPLPVSVSAFMEPTLSVGAHLKNSVAIANGHDVFVSQHIGDLETSEAFTAFEGVIESLEDLYQVAPEVTACDAHPDYISTRWAERHRSSPVHVQHHYAHILSCMAENDIKSPVLGIAWDGTGYGDDGTIWGGEFLHVTDEGYNRAGHLRTFMLPGGDSAAREPRRSAIGLLFEMFGDDAFEMKHLAPVRAFPNAELTIMREMLGKRINTAVTSSAGRLFDAVAAIVGLRDRVRFEGQAAMELEFIAAPGIDAIYGFEIHAGDDLTLSVNWELAVRSIIADILDGISVPVISAKFHNTLAEMMVSVARRVGEQRVVLSGGCFQNKYLTERAISRLRHEGFSVYWHQRVPTNDGGISLGQTMAAARQMDAMTEGSKTERRTELICA